MEGVGGAEGGGDPGEVGGGEGPQHAALVAAEVDGAVTCGEGGGLAGRVRFGFGFGFWVGVEGGRERE